MSTSVVKSSRVSAYYKAHPEKQKKRNKTYYEANKAELLRKKREKYAAKVASTQKTPKVRKPPQTREERNRLARKRYREKHPNCKWNRMMKELKKEQMEKQIKEWMEEGVEFHDAELKDQAEGDLRLDKYRIPGDFWASAEEWMELSESLVRTKHRDKLYEEIKELTPEELKLRAHEYCLKKAAAKNDAPLKKAAAKNDAA